MAKFRLQVSEARNLEVNLSAGWLAQLRSLDISLIFRVIGWLFVGTLAIMPLLMYAEWGTVRPESEQLLNLLLLGGAGLLLLLAWISLGKFQHFADPPMFLAILIFAMAQIAILLANATSGAANQLNTFGGPGSKLFSGVAVMAFVAIFYTSIVTLNTRRKRRLIGLALLFSLLAVVTNTVIQTSGQEYVSSLLVIAAWLVSATVILGGYRRLLLVASVFAFVISSFILVSDRVVFLALPITLALSLAYTILQSRKSQISLRSGWILLWNDFREFVRGELSWADFATAHKARLWLVVSVVLGLVTIIVMLSPAKQSNPTAEPVRIFELARTDVETATTEFSRLWSSLNNLGKLFFGNGFSANQADGTVNTIFAATGLIGLASYLLLAVTAIMLAVKQWWSKPYASWAGLWWPVMILLPIFLVFYRIDFTALIVWWMMFTHLSAIEHWEKQGKIYRLWNLLTLRGREYTKPFILLQIIVLVLLGLFFVMMTNNLLDLFVKQVI